MCAALADSCRLCLETSALISMFSTDGDISISEKAVACLGIKVQNGDGLPSLICSRCELNLNQFYEFRQKCRAVERDLMRKNKRTSKDGVWTQESTNSTLDGWKIEIKPEIDGIISHGLDQLGDWLPENNGHNSVYNEIKNGVCIESLDLQAAFEHQIQLEPGNILCNFSTENPNKYDQNKQLPKLSCKERCVKTSQSHGPVQCELCGKIFKHKTILKKHLRTHSGVKLFSCKICSKKFTRAEHEVVHMRAHRGIRPFICEVCARAFTKRQDLLRHMRIHSEEKKYECPRCSRRFKRSGDVQSHLRSHTGARPYACAACDKAYSSHSGLKKHFRVHCSKPTAPASDDAVRLSVHAQ